MQQTSSRKAEKRRRKRVREQLYKPKYFYWAPEKVEGWKRLFPEYFWESEIKEKTIKLPRG